MTQLMLGIVCVTAAILPGKYASSQSTASSSSVSTPASRSHMSEDLRAAIDNVVVVGGLSPTEQEITGTYEDITPGFIGGVGDGASMGTQSAQIGGVTINIPISILTIPGAVYGGISGSAKRQAQELRDAMTDDLAEANQPLINDRLAQDVYQSLRGISGLDAKLFAATTPIPEDVDAILYVSVKGVTIEVDDDDAVLTATVEATLNRRSDGSDVYRKLVQYQDQDSLKNWTADDNALWRDYANFARHYLGREISAEVFNQVRLNHELLPTKSESIKTKKNVWQGSSKSTMPTLAWDLKLLGDDSYGAWAEGIDDNDIYFDVEIYDVHRLVYAERNIPDSFHTLRFDIDPCKTYRWSVRPSYHVDDDIRFGEWMRSGSTAMPGNAYGIAGEKASAAPAYIQDFATLKIDCGRK